jgi:hypothetical protein
MLLSEASLLNKRLMLSSNSKFYDFGHTVVLLKSNLCVQQTHLSLGNNSLCLAPALGVTKFKIPEWWFWSHFVVLLRSDLGAQQTYLWGQFVEQKFMLLNSNFRCYQIHNCQRYDFGNTLLRYLSPTLMFNKPNSETGLLNKSLCLAPALGVTKFKIARVMIMVTLCSAT